MPFHIYKTAFFDIDHKIFYSLTILELLFVVISYHQDIYTTL